MGVWAGAGRYVLSVDIDTARSRSSVCERGEKLVWVVYPLALCRAAGTVKYETMDMQDPTLRPIQNKQTWILKRPPTKSAHKSWELSATRKACSCWSTEYRHVPVIWSDWLLRTVRKPSSCSSLATLRHGGEWSLPKLREKHCWTQAEIHPQKK